MEMDPFIIEYKFKSLAQASKEIYAFNTKVLVQTSINEMKGLIAKLGCKGFQYTESPNGARYVRFIAIDKIIGEIPVQVDIPLIYMKTNNAPRKFLEREGFRLAVLDLKVKIYKITGDKSNVALAFAENILTKSGQPMARFLSTGSNLAGLLPGPERQ